MSEIDPQEFGALKAEVVSLRRDFDDINETLKSVAAKLDGINATLAEAKGGWRLLLAVGGAASVVGGFISWAASHVRIV